MRLGRPHRQYIQHTFEMVFLMLKPFNEENVVLMEQMFTHWASTAFNQWSPIGKVSDSPLRHSQIARIVGEIGGATACAYLEVELSDPSLDPSVRMTVVTVLGEIGLRQHVEMVERECRADEGVVRKVAFRAFEKICLRHGLHLFEGDPE